MNEPYYANESVTLYLGDCLPILAAMEEASVDAVVTDPPYGLEFMGREWDGADGFRRSLNAADAGRDSVFGRTSRTSPEYKTGKPSGARIRQASDADQTSGRAHNATTSLVARNAPESYVAGHTFQQWCEAWARECLRVLKPGGWMLAFGGSRTSHRLKCGIEDAGFELRNTVAELTGHAAPEMMWMYSQGMPKSLDAARAVDMTVCTLPGKHCMRRLPDDPKPDDHVCPESEEGAQWKGWGTDVAPAWEPIVVARKPLAGTLGANLLTYGTGALNVDGCRVPGERVHTTRNTALGVMNDDNWQPRPAVFDSHEAGRWPSNVVLVHSADCRPAGTRTVRGDKRQGGTGHRPGGFLSIGADTGDTAPNGPLYGDAEVEVWDCAEGCPVAELDRQSGVLTSGANPARRGSDKFRDAYGEFAGQAECVVHRGADSGGASRFFPVFKYQAKATTAERPKLPDGTAWPTVKPLPLIRWLVTLVTPPGGTVLDLFAGSGTTGEACVIEGFPCILIDKDPVAAELIKTRLAKPIQPVLFGEAS